MNLSALTQPVSVIRSRARTTHGLIIVCFSVKRASCLNTIFQMNRISFANTVIAIRLRNRFGGDFGLALMVLGDWCEMST